MAAHGGDEGRPFLTVMPQQGIAWGDSVMDWNDTTQLSRGTRRAGQRRPDFYCVVRSASYLFFCSSCAAWEGTPRFRRSASVIKPRLYGSCVVGSLGLK